MSVATELSRIQTAKSNIKAAIEAKGVSIPSTATIDTYPTYVQEIPQGGGSGETKDYFKITNRTATAGTITFSRVNSIYDLKLKISTDGTNWTDYTMSANTNITLPANGYVLIDGSNNEKWTHDSNKRWQINADVDHDVSGKISSMVGLDMSPCFAYMFYGDTHLYNASGLDMCYKNVAGFAFCNMFEGCTNLVTAPSLPATTLAGYCYQAMFKDCTNLLEAPELPATKMETNCYREMFRGCTNLLEAPELPATTLAGTCYQQMFNGCTNLVSAPVLSAETLANYCYKDMFNGCTSLSSITCFAMTTANKATQTWVAGINTTGILYVASGNSMNWAQGNDGYPSTWELKVYGEEPAPTGRTLTISNIPTPPSPYDGEDPYTKINIDDAENYAEFGIVYDWSNYQYVISTSIIDNNGDPVTGFTTAFTDSALTISGDWGDEVNISYEFKDSDEYGNCLHVGEDSATTTEYFDDGETAVSSITLSFPALETDAQCQCGKDGGDWDEDNQVCLHDAALIIDGVNIPDDGETHEYRILDSDGNTVSVLSIDTSDWSYTYEDNPDGTISHDIATLNVDDYGDLSAGGFRWEVTGFFYGEYDIQLDNTSLISSMPDFDGSSVANYISWDATEGDYVINTYSCYDEWNCMVNDCGNWNPNTGECECV